MGFIWEVSFRSEVEGQRSGEGFVNEFAVLNFTMELGGVGRGLEIVVGLKLNFFQSNGI